jgi:ribonuclease HI
MQIVISKVKSHAGDTWNEYVDGLANNWRYIENEESFIVDQD